MNTRIAGRDVAYPKGKDADSEEGQGHANNSSVALYAQITGDFRLTTRDLPFFFLMTMFSELFKKVDSSLSVTVVTEPTGC